PESVPHIGALLQVCANRTRLCGVRVEPPGPPPLPGSFSAAPVLGGPTAGARRRAGSDPPRSLDAPVPAPCAASRAGDRRARVVSDLGRYTTRRPRRRA